MELSLEFETEAFRAWTEEAVRHLDRDTGREFLQLMAFAFLERVIPKTPVDKGRARAGWHSYLLANGRPTQAGPDPEAVREGRAASAFTESFRKGDLHIVLINGVEYAVLLEYGSSKQAPAGFVRITFRELQMGGHANRLMARQLQRTVAQANRTASSRVRRRLPG